jgi:hypothetical protein
MKAGEFLERHAFKITAAIVILVIALVAWSIARAAGASATITWTHPTTSTDGSTLALTEIKETLIIWRRPGNSTVVGSARVPAPSTSTVVTGLVCGSFQFSGATVVKTDDAASVENTPTPYATGVACPPSPPTGLVAK